MRAINSHFPGDFNLLPNLRVLMLRRNFSNFDEWMKYFFPGEQVNMKQVGVFSDGLRLNSGYPFGFATCEVHRVRSEPGYAVYRQLRP